MTGPVADELAAINRKLDRVLALLDPATHHPGNPPRRPVDDVELPPEVHGP